MEIRDQQTAEKYKMRHILIFVTKKLRASLKKNTKTPFWMYQPEENAMLRRKWEKLNSSPPPTQAVQECPTKRIWQSSSVTSWGGFFMELRQQQTLWGLFFFLAGEKSVVWLVLKWSCWGFPTGTGCKAAISRNSCSSVFPIPKAAKPLALPTGTCSWHTN